MARPNKVGLDYFSIDCHISDEVELLEAECGLEGFAILIKIWQKIYSNGYYAEWNEDNEMLFARKINSSVNAVNSVINSSFKRNLLDKTLYETYGILTGSGIQKRYFKIVTEAKRKNITAEEKYLLIELIHESIELIPELSTQSKVKKKKEDNTIEKKSSRFTPPTVEQVKLYCDERTNKIDAENFIDHYSANGWMRGKNKIKDWKACVRTWERNSNKSSENREVANF